MLSNERPQRVVIAQVTPTEDGAEQAQPPRVVATERNAHLEALGLR